MEDYILFEENIEHAREGTYFTIPFTMPEEVETFSLKYDYFRYDGDETQAGAGMYLPQVEVNIIDIGLIGPHGEQVGASGSDKKEIEVNEVYATPGYRAGPLTPGEWGILVGAYKVAPEGVKVHYEMRLVYKDNPRWFKGDLHAHTLASDGVLTAEELALHARAHGLDFLAITDHNQMVTRDALPKIPGLTLIPGVEWTHYQGHANFLGVEKPFDGCFATNTIEEAQAKFKTARERGALITANHPFEESCPYRFDLNTLPFDCLEIWNGPMRESNLRALGLWQSLLSAGKKVPICGGSDYHRDSPFLILGGPTTYVYASSAGISDILAALRQGHAYITFAPNGPTLEFRAGEAIMGDTVSWPEVKQMRITADGLLAGDVIRVVTGNGATPILQAPAPGSFSASIPMEAPGFARVEILRSFIPGVPHLPAVISNPIYFEPA
jgi:hypothetical protein